MVMALDNNRAVVIGGSSNNQQIWTFGQDQGWVNMGTTLPQGIEYPNSTSCVIISGDDGSKVMEMFDLATTPNKVTNFVLITDSGQPGATGQTVGNQQSIKRKRDLSLTNWPTYNGTLAPTITRSDFRIAHSPDGILVITGGNTQVPIAMFDSKQNSWLNASAIIGTSQAILPSSSVVSPPPTPSNSTSTSTYASITAAATTSAASTGIARSKSLTVLGAILGAIFALAALLVIALVLLRWNKQKKKMERQSYVNEKNDDRLSFADQGAEFMHEAGGSVGHRYSQSLNSPNSGIQAFQNKSKTAKGHRRGLASDEAALVMNKSPLGMSEPMEMSQIVDSSRTSPTGSTKLNSTPQNPVKVKSPLAEGSSGLAPAPAVGPERSRSNGWSTYFANNEVTNLVSMQSPSRDTVNTIDPPTSASDFSRLDDNESNTKLKARGVKPLELNLGPTFDSQRLSMSRVTSGSPTFASSSQEFSKAQAAVIGRYAEQSTETSTPTTSAFVFSTPDKSKADSSSDTRSIRSLGSQYSVNSNPYFSGGVNPYHTNDPTAGYFTGKNNKSANNSPILRPKSNLSFVTDADSRTSAMTVFPGANGLPSPKFMPSKLGDSKSISSDIPIPRALIVGGGANHQANDSNASNVSSATLFPHGIPSPRVNTFGPGAVKPRIVDATSPTTSTYLSPPQPVATGKGTTVKMLSTHEDMSWLNINAER
jgi:hypothetical protein